MSDEKTIKVLSEKAYDRTRESRQSNLQRRNQVVDIYGMEFERQGATGSPATLYISVSPDLIYYERFEFKLIVQPFVIPIADGGTNPVSLDIKVPSSSTSGRSLSVSNNTVSPNPHDHSIPEQTVIVTPNPHTHTVSAGITSSSSALEDFEVWIGGIDITPYLKAQYDGAWITGEGIYPRPDLSNYDVLKAVGFMPEWQKGVILQPGYKKVELKGNGAFNVILVNYLKYSHVNR